MRSRAANKDDISAIRALARRAYIKYVPRIGRAPAPMVADFQSFVDAGQVHVMETEGAIAGYLIAFARENDYFIENVAVDPAVAGERCWQSTYDTGRRSRDESRTGSNGALYQYSNA